MIIRCAWCSRHLGEKPPLSDPTVSDGICGLCEADVRRAAGIPTLGPRPIDFSVPVRREAEAPGAARAARCAERADSR
jgi:hypothetical protein